MQSSRQYRKLEVKAGAQLRDARRDTRCRHLPKYRAGHVPRGIVELGVIERVEQVYAKLQLEVFTDGGVFIEREVRVVDARPVEEVPPCIAERPHCFSLETGWIEVEVARVAGPEGIGQFLNLAGIGENL